MKNRQEDKENISQVQKNFSCEKLMYKPPFSLKYGEIILISVTFIIIFIITTVVNRNLEKSKIDTINYFQKDMNVSSNNFSHEIEQLIVFTQQTNINLNELIENKKILNIDKIKKIYLGDLSLYIIDSKGTVIFESSHTNLLHDTDLAFINSVPHGVQKILPSTYDKENLRIVSQLAHGQFVIYYVPKELFFKIKNRILPFETANLLLVDSDNNTLFNIPENYNSLPSDIVGMSKLKELTGYKAQARVKYSELMKEWFEREKITKNSLIFILILIFNCLIKIDGSI